MSTSVLPSSLTVCSRAAVVYLTSSDEQARNDAFKHLTAILLNATKNLYIPETEKFIRDSGHAQDSARYSFAEEFLLAEFRPYLGMPEEMIWQAARDNKFRYLGRRFRQRLLNKIRNAVRRNKKYKQERYNDAWGEHQTTDGQAPGLEGPEEFDRYLESFDYLSEQDITVATVLFDLRLSEIEGKASRKSARTRAIAERFHVTEQTARRYIRQLQEKMNDALRNGHSATRELFDRLGAFIRTAPLLGRNLAFGYHQHQDVKHHEREWDYASLAEIGGGYSWKQRDALGRAGTISAL